MNTTMRRAQSWPAVPANYVLGIWSVVASRNRASMPQLTPRRLRRFAALHTRLYGPARAVIGCHPPPSASSMWIEVRR